MQFDVCSDIHIEFERDDTTVDDLKYVFDIEQRSDTLIIAGDICPQISLWKSYKNIKPLFNWLQSQYTNVVYVLGNHDYWGTMLETAACQYAELTGIRPLHNNSMVIDDCVLVGGTLWTNVTDYMKRAIIRSRMNDYRYIHTYTLSPISVEDTNYQHKQTMEVIKNVVKQNQDNKVVVVTHHAPLKQCTYEYLRHKTDLMQPFKQIAKESEGSDQIGYCNNFKKYLSMNKNIKAWIHGHAHMSVPYQYKDCQIIANPRGYVGREHYAEQFKLKTFTV